MPDLLVALAGNTIVAAALGLAALVAWRRCRAPLTAWVLVVAALVKLLTPPVLGPTWRTAEAPPPALLAGRITAGDAGGLDAPASWWSWSQLGTGALAVWLVGSLTVFGIILVRQRRLGRLLRRLDPAPLRVRTLAAPLVHDLGLRHEPQLLVTTARLSPFVFALGCRPRLVLPATLLGDADDRRLRAVLAHELAHLSNRDHLVRWLDLAVSVVFWWNPVAHALRGLLREVEEVRCDARAIAALGESAKRYGRAILDTADSLDDHTVPLGASGLDGGPSLRRRIEAIADGRLKDRLGSAARLTLAGATLAVLPLGVQEAESEPRTLVWQTAKPTAAQVAGRLAEATTISLGEEIATAVRVATRDLELPDPEALTMRLARAGDGFAVLAAPELDLRSVVLADLREELQPLTRDGLVRVRRLIGDSLAELEDLDLHVAIESAVDDAPERAVTMPRRGRVFTVRTPGTAEAVRVVLRHPGR